MPDRKDKEQTVSVEACLPSQRIWVRVGDGFERKKKKDEITPNLMAFMGNYQINDLNTKDGQLKFSKTNVAKPLSKKYLMNRIGDFFKNYDKGEEVVNFVYENREKEEKFKLHRVIKKSKDI